MSATRITSESYQSDILRCERCNTVLPKYSTFCGQCGTRVENSADNGPLKDKTQFTDQYRITSLVRRGPYTRIARALDIQQQRPVIICDVDLSILDTKARVQATHALQQEYDQLRRQQIQYTVPLIGLRSFSQHLYMVSAWPRNVQQESTSIPQYSTLQEILQSGIGLPDERTVLLWMQHMSQAVAELHQHQLLFTDLDPQTIIVPEANYQGEAALLLSCLPYTFSSIFSAAAPGTNATAFSAPEVLHGEAETRSDVYSLGAILYFLLTGALPTITTIRMRRRVRTPREINPRIQSALNDIVMQAIAKEATERIQSAEKLSQALASLYADSQPVQNAHVPTLHQNKLSVRHKNTSIQPVSTPVPAENAPTQPQPALPEPENPSSQLNNALTQPQPALPRPENPPVKLNSIFTKQENTLIPVNSTSTEQRNLLARQQNSQEEIKISSPDADNKSTGSRPTQQSPGLDDVTISIVPLQAQMARRYLSKIKSGQMGTQEQAAGEAIVEEGSSKQPTTEEGSREGNTRTQLAGKTADATSSSETLQTQSSASADLPLAETQVQGWPDREAVMPDVVEASAQEQNEELELVQTKASPEIAAIPSSKLGENREKALARLKDIFTGSFPAIPRINPPKLSSSHARPGLAETNSQPAAEVIDDKESSLLKRMQRFILGEQQHSTIAAALIETPLRIQPSQSYSIRINIMGRNTLKHEDAIAGLSGMVEGDIAHIEVRSALYQNYAYIVQQADVQVPAAGYVAEVTMPMQPLSSGPSGRRERLHVFFMDAAHSPLYEKPFVIELFISHLVQTGREGHSVLSIPL